MQSFQGSTLYHTEVSHELLPELSDEDQKDFYKIIKDELEVRGFTVKGKINNGIISLIIFSNTPRTSEMDRILKLYSEKDISLNLKQHSNGATGLSSSSTPDSNKDNIILMGNDLLSPLSPRTSPIETKSLESSDPKIRGSQSLSHHEGGSPISSNIKRSEKSRGSININDTNSKVSKPLKTSNHNIDPLNTTKNIKLNETKNTSVSLSSTGIFSPRKLEPPTIEPKISDDSNINNTEIDMDFIKRKLSQAKKDKAKK